jgi:dihydrofolate reductase
MIRCCPKRHEDMDVAKVLSHMCMSLDGFIAQPDDNPAELFEWYWGGGCGAIVAGRRLFDQSDGWGDNHPAGSPVVVVTHRPPPDDADRRFPRTTFTSSVPEAITAAKHIAGDKFVTIASANIIQQAINLDLVDELCVSLVPVLFGSGIRYFGDLVDGHVTLDDPVVVRGIRALHLRYPVRH